MNKEFEKWWLGNKVDDLPEKYTPLTSDNYVEALAYAAFQAGQQSYPPEIVELIEAAREYSQHLPMDDDKIARHSKHLRDSMNLRKAIENIKE